jgi:homoserine kinase
MKATTVKLDGDLLDALERQKPDKQSVTAYVREVLRRDVNRRRLREAAEAYCALLQADPREREDMETWTAADLTSEPERRPRRQAGTR